MGVGPKLRFEVFQRDGFTCQYCGRKTPEVILECDHVVPVSKGGTDEIENLTTSCWACNRGKSDVALGDLPASADVRERTIALAEREMQLHEYNEVRRQIAAREQREIATLTTRWNELCRACPPDEAALRNALQRHSVFDILDAIDVVSGKEKAGVVSYHDQAIYKYFFGVLRRKLERSTPTAPHKHECRTCEECNYLAMDAAATGFDAGYAKAKDDLEHRGEVQ